MNTREYSLSELMGHLKGASEQRLESLLKVVCVEAYDEIDRLVAAIEGAIEDLNFDRRSFQKAQGCNAVMTENRTLRKL